MHKLPLVFYYFHRTLLGFLALRDMRLDEVKIHFLQSALQHVYSNNHIIELMTVIMVGDERRRVHLQSSLTRKKKGF